LIAESEEVNYDRRHVEAVKRRSQGHHFPFLRVFLILSVLVFALMAVLR
jgi:hypothetical protein